MVSTTKATASSRRHILDLLLSRDDLSRADLARLAHLTKPTVSGLVAGLIQEGLVREVGAGVSTGGRRPILLTVPGDSRLTVGVELDATNCRLLLVTLHGERLALSDVPLGSTEPTTVVEAISDGIDGLFAERDRGALLGVGVAVPGLVDQQHQTVASAPRLGWDMVSLHTLLRERLGVPVMVTDRGKAAGLGELWVLGRDRSTDLVYLYLGAGVAGAVVLQGTLHWGSVSTAGEVGHMTILPDGPPCACGNDGCLEALVSAQAIAARARRAVTSVDGTSPAASALADVVRDCSDDLRVVRAVGEAATEGDPAAAGVVAETGRWLGIAIANIINALDPALIVLGGPTAEWGQSLIASVEREVARRALPLPRRAARIVIGHARDLAAALGAAALVLQQAPTILAGTRPDGTAASLVT
ncbi:MAG TPA: ROK family protein [Thermomicrobiales bacterium]|nr:ROK family protein [Thermomicrobiales bacterium]